MDPAKFSSRFPKNVEGPFFVVNGECIACMAQEHEAPDLMDFDQDAHHCYFKKRPITAEESEPHEPCGPRVVVQYSGNDPAVNSRIAELHEENLKGMRHQEKRPWWKFW